MKRDLDLVREILLSIEQRAPGASGFSLSGKDDFSKREINEHCELLVEAGLLDGKVLRGAVGIVDVHINRLTWKGHDFLDASRDATLWGRAKKLVLEKGGAFTFDLLVTWLKKEAADRLGLPSD